MNANKIFQGGGATLRSGNRLKQALSKLSFCIRICCNTADLIKLIRNTKRFSKFSNSQRPAAIPGSDEICKYRLNLSGARQQVFLRTYSGDIQMFYEVFWKDVYSIDLQGKNKSLTIIDAGANIGMASLYFLAKNDAAIVYAIEPDSSNFAILEQNLSFASMRVKLIHCALSSTNGTCVLERDGWAFNSALRPYAKATVERPDQPRRSSEIIDTKTMQNIIEDHCISKIDLLKIDIEGSEAAVFSSNTEWLHIVETILIEIHDETTETDIITVLTNYNFQTKKWNKNEFGNVYLAKKNEPVN